MPYASTSTKSCNLTVPPASNAAAALESPGAEQSDDVIRVMTAIAAGTLIELWKFLGCSQAAASTVRKEIAKAIEQ